MKPHYKPIPSESKLFKVEFQKNTKEFYYPWHYHSELELAFILSGKGVRYVGNSIENFYEEELVLLGSNLPHTWNTTADQEQPVTAIVIYLKEEFFDKSWMQSIEFESIRNLAVSMNKGIKVDNGVVMALKQKFFNLLNASPFDKLMILLQILQDLAHNSAFRFLCEQEFTGDLNDTDKTRINAVYNYIQTHYQEQVSLADIASKLNMSEEYFSRYFSKTMKKPFFEFLNEYKINRACKLLIETDKQISEICYASGFESIPFFYRQFKKFKDCQPKTYRMNYQKVSLYQPV
ncbi:AraC family transcriptional regulator [Agriterribacter sp.]|uniref:AraC family transcriptional regulator n=1 Tax=Agriterribacter sp. TaxID=2821509 RepID=UPI002CF96FF2|nr:AraC family transcriptional regulator [Agriterribacter sp.]HRO47067.1 AraC family transcriptional regulator [Agriterribacter sp.]HRQ19034.1 AraC family transcriptional regulator [Agriterribacter sp.]